MQGYLPDGVQVGPLVKKCIWKDGELVAEFAVTIEDVLRQLTFVTLEAAAELRSWINGPTAMGSGDNIGGP